MSDDELARVREGVAQLSPRTRGAEAVAAGRGVAAAVVLGASDSAAVGANPRDWSTVGAGWIAFGAVHLVAIIAAGASHLGGRGGRLEAETGADVALVSTLVAVALSLVAVRLLARMPAPMRSATAATAACTNPMPAVPCSDMSAMTRETSCAFRASRRQQGTG